jgi:hypothetical protein
MTRHVGDIHDSKLEPFSSPCFCQSGVGLEEYTYHYQKGYRQVTGEPYIPQQHEPLRMAPLRRCEERCLRGWLT